MPDLRCQDHNFVRIRKNVQVTRGVKGATVLVSSQVPRTGSDPRAEPGLQAGSSPSSAVLCRLVPFPQVRRGASV